MAGKKIYLNESNIKKLHDFLYILDCKNERTFDMQKDISSLITRAERCYLLDNEIKRLEPENSRLKIENKEISNENKYLGAKVRGYRKFVGVCILCDVLTLSAALLIWLG